MEKYLPRKNLALGLEQAEKVCENIVSKWRSSFSLDSFLELVNRNLFLMENRDIGYLKRQNAHMHFFLWHQTNQCKKRQDVKDVVTSKIQTAENIWKSVGIYAKWK